MEKFYVFAMSEKGQAFEFVVGVKRKWWLGKKRLVKSVIPHAAKVENYEQLSKLVGLAEKEYGRHVHVNTVDVFESIFEQYQYFALRLYDTFTKHVDVDWLTGRWGSDGRPITSKDIRECQLFMRRYYSGEVWHLIAKRTGIAVTVERVYVNRENTMLKPCMVTVAVNKKTKAVRYVRRVRSGDGRLYYADKLEDAMLIYPEDTQKMHDGLSKQHGGLTFAMIVKPNQEMTASEAMSHFTELSRPLTMAFHIGKGGRDGQI